MAAGCLGGWAKQARGEKGTFLCPGTVLSYSGTRQYLAIVPVAATTSTVTAGAALLALRAAGVRVPLELPSLSCSP